MLGSLILYLKGMRIVMFQLSGSYYKAIDIIGSARLLLYSDEGRRIGSLGSGLRVSGRV